MSAQSTKRNKSKAESLNTLDALVRTDGVGEDPAVKALLSDDFVKGSNVQALEIASSIQQLVRGMNIMQEKFSDQFSKIHKRMDEMDKAAEAWEKDKQKFIEDVLSKSPPTGDKDVAKGVETYRNALNEAKAQVVYDRLSFDKAIASMPTVTVVSPGELVTVVEGGRPVNKFMNEVVNIKHRKWVLPVGQAVEVPKLVAEVLNQRRRTQMEQEEREQLLSKRLESDKMREGWEAINKKYNSSTDSLPQV